MKYAVFPELMKHQVHNGLKTKIPPHLDLLQKDKKNSGTKCLPVQLVWPKSYQKYLETHITESMDAGTRTEYAGLQVNLWQKLIRQCEFLQTLA